MRTVCTGWKTRHPEVILKADDGKDNHVSHGICPGCLAEWDTELTKTEEQKRVQAEYDTVLISPFDPRD